MSIKVLLGAATVSWWLCGCTLNGKPISFGGGGGGAGHVVGGGGDSAAPPQGESSVGVVTARDGVVVDTASNGYEAAHAEGKARRPPVRPADPWAAVDGELPRRSPQPDYYFVSTTANDCSAAHDHCLPDDIWFVEDHQKLKDLLRSFSTQQYRGVDPDHPWSLFGRATSAGNQGIAHRAVPATRRHLVKGALAITLPYPNRAPVSEEDASASWVGGIVESVDWEAGKLQLVGHPTLHWISATRVVVLTYTPGGKVEIRGKLGKDKLAASADETIAPKQDLGAVADPWAEVGADGQPREPTDMIKLEQTDSVTCDAAHDHCLRPWVWFIEDHRGAWPVRFRDGAFHRFSDVDDLGDAHDGAAYRTVPVDPAKLAKGTRVYFRDSSPGSERDAHFPEWELGDVSEVQVEANVFRIKGDDHHHSLDTARVPVLMWFPGEKAEPVE